MESAELYGLEDLNSHSVNRVDEDSVDRMKVILIDWLTEVITSRDFILQGIDTNVLEGKEELDAALGDIVRCTSELIDATLESMGYVNRAYLQAIGIACLIIAMKIMGAHDWIYGDVDYYALVGNYGDGAKGSSPMNLRLMEHDILERTDWKGCPSSFIHTPEESFFGLRHKNRHSCMKRSSKSRRSGMKSSSKSRRSGMKHSSKSRRSREDFF